ncbi:MAG: aldehyde dehydrogenase [Clostridia bacterium]|nr:aldehyde dehydrogenase [Clostridia bacterium]
MEISEVVELQRKYFKTGKTKDIKFRLETLKKLKTNILAMDSEICEALKVDLGKSAMESYMSEIGMVISELNHTIKHLKKWSKRKRVKTPIAQISASSFVTYEPYGVVLIIAPWNYPFLLSIDPLIGAISAGNTVVLKPSKEAPNVGLVIKKLVDKTFAESHAYVVQGSTGANRVILEEKYDYVFFTGGQKVGKIVAEKCGANLTPVSLELGGKSPCIVDKNVDLDLVCRRIAFGKFLNCGQTCIAPDYCLVNEDIKDEFLDKLAQNIAIMYGEKPLENDDYGKIINKTQFDALVKYLSDGEIVCGGAFNKETLRIEPTVLKDISREDSVMQEEIFGPILPVLTYKTKEDILGVVESYDKPLALYVFTRNKKFSNWVLSSISFGGGCINDTIMHIANPNLCFGGVGGSGMGKYHGKYSFETFSNQRPIVNKHNYIDLSVRYQPYSKGKEKFVRTFMK